MSRRVAFILVGAFILALFLAAATPAFANYAYEGDRNHDRIPDWWEVKYGLSLRVNQAYRDQDLDGLVNIAEFKSRTSPRRKDSDGDGLWDRREDPDRDKMTNLAEYITRTHPLKWDSDYDGVSDAREDPDGDRLRNYNEFQAATRPLSPDSDRDGLVDGLEDRDKDGLNNVQDVSAKTHPGRWDTDSDGVWDGDEDTDVDQLDNEDEYIVGTDPTDPDTDDDTVLDGEEFYGVVKSFDRETGILVVHRAVGEDAVEGDGGEVVEGETVEGEDEGEVPDEPEVVVEDVTVTVDADTVLEWADYLTGDQEEVDYFDGFASKRAADRHWDGEGGGEEEWPDEPDPYDPYLEAPTVENLLPGAVIAGMETQERDDGSLRAVRITLADYEAYGSDDPDMEYGD